jgi:hypothetical protein
MSWGTSPIPLLPETLRLEWAADPLPEWVCQDLGLPANATCASLDGSMWRTAPTLPERIFAFVSNLVAARRGGIDDLPVFATSIPPEFQLESLPFSSRVKNALERQKMLTRPEQLSEIKFGALLSLKGFGVRSALDLACTVEAFRSASIGTDLDDVVAESERTSAALLEFLDETEAAQLSAHDARFADVLATVPGSVADYLDVALGTERDTATTKPLTSVVVNALRDRVAAIRELPLDLCLRELAAATTRLDGRRLQALCERLGFDGMAPRTLEEAGRTIGVTRERMRQIENKFKSRLPDHDLFIPRLDDAIDLLSSSVPMTAAGATKLMAASGICTKPFSSESVIAAAEISGRTVDFTVQLRNDVLWAVHNEFVRDSRAIASIAKRQAQASGASNVQDVIEELKVRKKTPSTPETVRTVLKSVAGFELLDDDWFWLRTGKRSRNRLRNVARKILSVAAPLDIAVLREGVRRIYRGRGNRGLGTWPLVVPPRSVLKAFFEAHPEFTIEADGLVTSAKPLDYRNELTGTEEVLVDVLRSTSSGVLDRTTYARRCAERGMNLHTFSQYLSFSPVINHLGTDLWSLRGVRVDPASVEVLRQMNALRPGEKRIVDYGWSESGLLWVTVRVPELTASPVAVIPIAVRRFLANREFAARDETNNEAGRIRVSEDGVCYGFAPYLRRRGADGGDLLMLKFDIGSSAVDLQLSDEEFLESVSPVLA